MILKIPVEVGEHVVVGLFRRDSINLCLPKDEGAKSQLYVNNIATPLTARVRHALLSEFLGRAHGSSEGSMDVQKLIDKVDHAVEDGTVVDPMTGQRVHKTLHFRNQEDRMRVGDVVGRDGRQYRVTRVWGAGQDLFNFDAELIPNEQ
jgi:hypothetical protein